MHNIGYKSALVRRACRYSDARPPRKTDGIPPESESPPRMRGKVGSGPIQSEAPLQGKKRQLHYPLSRLLHQKYASVLLLSMARHKFVKAPKSCLLFCVKTPRLPVAETGAVIIFYWALCSQRLTQLLAGVLDSSLRSSQTCDRHTEGRAADVVQANIVAELDAGGIAAVLAADAQTQIGAGLAAIVAAVWLSPTPRSQQCRPALSSRQL